MKVIPLIPLIESYMCQLKSVKTCFYKKYVFKSSLFKYQLFYTGVKWDLFQKSFFILLMFLLTCERILLGAAWMEVQDKSIVAWLTIATDPISSLPPGSGLFFTNCNVSAKALALSGHIKCMSKNYMYTLIMCFWTRKSVSIFLDIFFKSFNKKIQKYF